MSEDGWPSAAVKAAFNMDRCEAGLTFTPPCVTLQMFWNQKTHIKQGRLSTQRPLNSSIGAH
jgi:hypothetical protein